VSSTPPMAANGVRESALSCRSAMPLANWAGPSSGMSPTAFGLSAPTFNWRPRPRARRLMTDTDASRHQQVDMPRSVTRPKDGRSLSQLLQAALFSQSHDLFVRQCRQSRAGLKLFNDSAHYGRSWHLLGTFGATDELEIPYTKCDIANAVRENSAKMCKFHINRVRKQRHTPSPRVAGGRCRARSW